MCIIIPPLQIENRSSVGHQNSLQASSAVYNPPTIVTTTKDHHQQQSIILQQALTNISTTSSITHSNYNGNSNSANNICNSNKIISHHITENGQEKNERETVMVIGTTTNLANNDQYRMPIQSSNINNLNDRIMISNTQEQHGNQMMDYAERHKINDIRNLEIAHSRPMHIMNESKLITKQVRTKIVYRAYLQYIDVYFTCIPLYFIRLSCLYLKLLKLAK